MHVDYFEAACRSDKMNSKLRVSSRAKTAWAVGAERSSFAEQLLWRHITTQHWSNILLSRVSRGYPGNPGIYISSMPADGPPAEVGLLWFWINKCEWSITERISSIKLLHLNVALLFEYALPPEPLPVWEKGWGQTLAKTSWRRLFTHAALSKLILFCLLKQSCCWALFFYLWVLETFLSHCLLYLFFPLKENNSFVI